MKQMVQLASQFLSHDSLLIFFIPLMYGRKLTDITNGSRKAYLSDPIANVSRERRSQYMNGVREALHCLSHSVQFQYAPPIKRVYARTLRSERTPAHSSSCCPAFQRKYSCDIELADNFASYYNEKYSTASRCEQFRHDFLFAATLVHEIVHAVGVLRRGDLSEPHIRVDCPETEWGYGWEHFMFGNVINPQDRTKPGTHLLMRKVWADQKAAEDAGGKEYCDVPMSYIAQFFRKETWKIVAKQGPTAIPPPKAHFKIQSSNKYGAWVVSSDHPDVKQDLVELQDQWKRRTPSSKEEPSRSSSTLVGKPRSTMIRWRSQTTEELQRMNVSGPVRIPKRLQQCMTCGHSIVHDWTGPHQCVSSHVQRDLIGNRKRKG